MKIKKTILAFLLFLAGCSSNLTANVVKEYVSETKNPIVKFCPEEDCEKMLVDLINSAQNSCHCAFYDLNLESIIDAMNKTSKKADVKLVMDNENYINFSFSKKDGTYGLMHNKFCIIDGRIVFTGSMNPTVRDSKTNNNNIIIINSEKIAEQYDKEFQELWNGQFGKGKKEGKTFYINNKKIDVFFCPDDWCANKVIYTLNEAKKSVYFMTFSFTHDKIADVLIKKKKEGLDVKGIIEKSQNNAYCEYNRLKNNSIGVIWDKNKANMHHKVFIIDESVVITGSFNPTMNADTRNDENLLVIYDSEIAKKYLNEFNKLYNAWSENQ